MGLSGCLYCEGALLAHGQLGLNQGPQLPFCKAAFQPVGLQPVLVWRGYSSPGVEFSQPLDELQRTLFGPFLQPTGVPPNSSTSTGGYQHMNCECDTTDEKEHRGQKTASLFSHYHKNNGIVYINTDRSNCNLHFNVFFFFKDICINF